MAELSTIFNAVYTAAATLLRIGGSAAHDAAASGNPVQVGGVYRVADPAVADGDVASLRVNAKGEALVSLTGRDVVEITIFNALAIRDTSDHDETVDLSAYRSVFLYAINSHGQIVTLTLREQGESLSNWDGANWAFTQNTFVLPASSAARRVLNTVCTMINQQGLKTVVLRAVCSVAPAAGSLTVKGWGVPN